MIKKFLTEPLGVNTYLIYDHEGNCMIIDPADMSGKIDDFIKEKGLKLSKVLLTHGHGDHIYAVNHIRNKYDVTVMIHKDDAEIIETPEYNYSKAIFGQSITIPEYEVFSDGDTIVSGVNELKVVHTPGHTRGSCCFVLGDTVFSGDTLFRESVGRYDLYGGNGRQILSSIKDKIFTMKGDTKVLPGHGDSTTVRHEKNNNPFIR